MDRWRTHSWPDGPPPSPLRKLIQKARLKRYMLSGVMILVPAVIVYYLLSAINSHTSNLFKESRMSRLFTFPFAGLLVTLVFIWVVGFVLSSPLRPFAWLDEKSHNVGRPGKLWRTLRRTAQHVGEFDARVLVYMENFFPGSGFWRPAWVMGRFIVQDDRFPHTEMLTINYASATGLSPGAEDVPAHDRIFVVTDPKTRTLLLTRTTSAGALTPTQPLEGFVPWPEWAAENPGRLRALVQHNGD